MKIKVGVFFGGKSVEHEVSIITAIQAIENFDMEKYDVIPIYIAKDNKMYVGEHIGNIKKYDNIDKLLQESIQVTLIQDGDKVGLLRNTKKLFGSNIFDYIDVAFPIVHGTNVEDGTIQGYLKMFNIPYVGCDVASSAIGMDKYACKCLLKENNIPVLDCKCFAINEYNEDLKGIIKKAEECFEYPVIVKPINLGSSVGIEIAKNTEELEEAFSNAFLYSKKVLVEKAISNLKEVNCSVIGDYEEAVASECEEPVKTDDILSFENKYLSGSKSGGTKSSMNEGVLKLPAEISNDIRLKIQELAIKTFKVLGCTGVIRIDFMIDLDSNTIYVNEVNTIPGSLSFHLWRATNLKYKELLSKLIDLSLKRNREDKSLTFSFETNLLSGYAKTGLKGGIKK